MGHIQVTKMYIEETIYSIRTLDVVQILSFQRDLVSRQQDLVKSSELAQRLIW